MLDAAALGGLLAVKSRWRESLQSALGAAMTEDDLMLELQEAAAKAGDLVAELEAAAAPPPRDGAAPRGWRALEAAAQQLEGGLQRARELTRGLKAHAELLEDCGLMDQLG